MTPTITTRCLACPATAEGRGPCPANPAHQVAVIEVGHISEAALRRVAQILIEAQLPDEAA